MNQTVIQEFSHVHDNQIVSYHVDVDDHILTLVTRSEAKETTEIVFTGWMAHRFENVSRSNIIFGITQVTIDYYINTNEDFLKESMRYAFPACFNSIGALRQHLIEGKYNIYEVSSSQGLTGTVIAKDIKINVSNQA